MKTESLVLDGPLRESSIVGTEFKISGLGFDMEFDLKELLSKDFASLCNSEDINSPYCFVYDTFEDSKKYDGNSSYLKTLNEYRLLKPTFTYRTHLDYYKSNVTKIKCSKITGMLMILTDECLNSCGLDIHKNPGLLNVDSLDRISSVSGKGVLSTEQMCYLNRHITESFFDYTNLEKNKLSYYLSVNSSFVFRQIMIALKRCLCMYISSYLNLAIKEVKSSMLLCDASIGKFSTTYNIKLHFGDRFTMQSVTVKSDNMI